MDDKYFKKNFFVKYGIQIKQIIKDYFHHYKFPFHKLIIFLVIIISVFTIYLIVSKNKRVFPVKASYDKTGFLMYDEINKPLIILENNNYSFVLDTSNTHFTLNNKINNVSFKSNPTTTPKVDTLTIYYATTLGTPNKYGNYNYSINYESVHRYMIKEGENYVEVLYLLGGKVKIDYTDFPQLISKERFEDMIINRANDYINNIDDLMMKTRYKTYLSYVKSSYKLNNIHNYYALENGQALSSLYINALYEIFYNVCSYTKDDLDLDNLEHDIITTKKYPTFEVSLKYELSDEGLHVTLVNEAIVDTQDYPIIYIDVLPHFGAAADFDSGYIVVPDGIGALMEFNNNKEFAKDYEKRIYGFDYANYNQLNINETTIMFPMYGMNINDKGFINVVTQGMALCSINCILNNKSMTPEYNRVFYRVYLRETNTYRFESLAGLSDIQTWTNEINQEDVCLFINLLDHANYYNIIMAYKDYLIQNGILKKNIDTNQLNLNINLLGGYYIKNNFLGINYYQTKALTKYQDILDLVKYLEKDHINDYSLFYQGFINRGIKSSYNGKITNHHNIISQKELSNLYEYLNSQNIDFYPTWNLQETHFLKNLNEQKLIKDQYGKTIINYDYNEAINDIDNSTIPTYYLKPSTFNKTISLILKHLEKQDIQHLAFFDLGNLVYGSYQRKDFYFRSDTLSIIQKMLVEHEDVLTKYHLAAVRAQDYLLKYLTCVKDLPLDVTDYSVVTATIPIYPLILNDYVYYSLEPFNQISQGNNNFDYYKLKAIEYLASPSVTWMYEEPYSLVDSEYDKYCSSYYLSSYPLLKDLYEELKALNIFNHQITNHQFLDNTKHLYISYANNINIILNYDNQPYVYQVLDQEYLVDANSYLVIKDN